MRLKTVTAAPFTPAGFRLTIENMPHGNTAHEVLAVVFQVRMITVGREQQSSAEKPQLNVLLWQRAQDPQKGAWSLPGDGCATTRI
ncbi:hypothetical protein BZL30_8180 [Mycobacterium kansasii]|uniref:Uncharacterized protein n=1 Tax=Mycobacterium kansasii TaxID=1768 RepID=A0A1V3WIZ0_MYCKA|nr:hypothetical protein BZL30_8180 [Mycobacterium kansasii]